MDNEKTTGELKITDDMMWKEAGELVDKGIICCCSALMSDVFIPLANECDKRRIFDSEELCRYCCPECGSCDFEDNWEEDEEDEEENEQGGAFVCCDCGHKFDDPDYIDPLEFWFVKDWMGRLLENNGEMIIRTDYTPDIWCRCTSGQSISSDGVIWRIAKKDILERFELERKYKK